MVFLFKDSVAASSSLQIYQGNNNNNNDNYNDKDNEHNCRKDDKK